MKLRTLGIMSAVASAATWIVFLTYTIVSEVSDDPPLPSRIEQAIRTLLAVSSVMAVDTLLHSRRRRQDEARVDIDGYAAGYTDGIAHRSAVADLRSTRRP